MRIFWFVPGTTLLYLLLANYGTTHADFIFLNQPDMEFTLQVPVLLNHTEPSVTHLLKFHVRLLAWPVWSSSSTRCASGRTWQTWTRSFATKWTAWSETLPCPLSSSRSSSPSFWTSSETQPWTCLDSSATKSRGEDWGLWRQGSGAEGKRGVCVCVWGWGGGWWGMHLCIADLCSAFLSIFVSCNLLLSLFFYSVTQCELEYEQVSNIYYYYSVLSTLQLSFSLLWAVLLILRVCQRWFETKEVNHSFDNMTAQFWPGACNRRWLGCSLAHFR